MKTLASNQGVFVGWAAILGLAAAVALGAAPALGEPGAAAAVDSGAGVILVYDHGPSDFAYRSLVRRLKAGDNVRVTSESVRFPMRLQLAGASHNGIVGAIRDHGLARPEGAALPESISIRWSEIRQLEVKGRATGTGWPLGLVAGSLVGLAAGGTLDKKTLFRVGPSYEEASGTTILYYAAAGAAAGAIIGSAFPKWRPVYTQGAAVSTEAASPPGDPRTIGPGAASDAAFFSLLSRIRPDARVRVYSVSDPGSPLVLKGGDLTRSGAHEARIEGSGAQRATSTRTLPWAEIERIDVARSGANAGAKIGGAALGLAWLALVVRESGGADWRLPGIDFENTLDYAVVSLAGAVASTWVGSVIGKTIGSKIVSWKTAYVAPRSGR